MTATQLTIRASMLPSYHDCPKRSIARAWPRSIEERGFALRRPGHGIGAAIGTGAHAGATHLLKEKRDGREYRECDAVEIAINALRAETSGEIIYDASTTTLNTAEKQVVRMTAVFLYQVLPICQPVSIEVSRRASISSNVLLQGRLDLETKDEALWDWKMGAVPRWYLSQFGGYSLLRRSNGGTLPSRLVLGHIPRVKIDKPQPPANFTNYDPVLAERSAWSTTGFIIRDFRAFEATGDPWQIPSNPMSFLCSAKFCPAWGTPFCVLKGPRSD